MTAWCWGFDIDDGDMALIDTMDRGDGFAWATGDPRYMGQSPSPRSNIQF